MEIRQIKNDGEVKEDPGVLERVVNAEEAQHFICQVCRDILNDPLECSNCRNVFCKRCQGRWQNQHLFQVVCPLRCENVSMMKISIPFKNQLESLKVYCKNKDSGCSEVLLLGTLAGHEQNCQFELVKCYHDQCKKVVRRGELEVHLPQCEFMPKKCEHCEGLVPQGYLDQHVDTSCQEVILECKMCALRIPRKKMLQHMDFECSENEVKCKNFPSCKERFKQKFLGEHLSSQCDYEQVECDQCTLKFIRCRVKNHDCVAELIKNKQRLEEKMKSKKEQVKEQRNDIAKYKEVLKEKEKRIFELENQLQSDNLQQFVGMRSGLAEEQKEQFYRRDPTFQKEASHTIFSGGSIEVLLFLQNGHMAISGSSQNNKLVICEVGEQFKIVEELQDHTGSITGLIELDDKLISCCLDKTIIIYDIKVRKPNPSEQVQQKGMGRIFSCFTKKSLPSSSQINRFEYKRANSIFNAHPTQIFSIVGIPLKEKFFATGSTKEIKIWNCFECLHIIQNAHLGQVYSLKVVRMLNVGERRKEIYLMSGSKDKYLKFWNIQNLVELWPQDGSVDHGNLGLQQSQLAKHCAELNASHFHQINTVEQLSDDLFLSGTSDGSIVFWKHQMVVNSNLEASSQRSSRMVQVHQAQVFTVSTLHIQLLTNYNYNQHPYVAIAGKVSKVIIYDVKNLTVIQSLRVLISNWQTYIGMLGIPEDKLAVGCLDGSIKIYKPTYD